MNLSLIHSYIVSKKTCGEIAGVIISLQNDPKFSNVDHGICFKSCVLKLIDIIMQY